MIQRTSTINIDYSYEVHTVFVPKLEQMDQKLCS